MSHSHRTDTDADNNLFDKLTTASFNQTTGDQESTFKSLAAISYSERIKSITDINASAQYDSMAIFKRFLLSKKGETDSVAHTISSKTIKDEESSMHQDQTKDDESLKLKTKTEKFLSLQEFKNENIGKDIVQENLILVVQDLPRFVTGSKVLIENFIDHVIGKIISDVSVQIKEQTLTLNMDYQWSIISNDSFIAAKGVFVKFNDIFTMYIFYQILNGLRVDITDTNLMRDYEDFQCISVFATTQIQENVFPQIQDALKLAYLVDYQAKACEQIKHIFELSDHNNSAIDVDEYTKMYNNYKIDFKDISHIPSDMIETVKTNLIEFRLLALKVEKERKEQRKLQEEIRTHEKLKALLRTMDHSNDNMDRSNKSLNTRPHFDEEDDKLTDFEIETNRVNQEHLDLEKKYTEALKDYRKREIKRLSKYKKFNSSLQHDLYLSRHIPMMRKQFLEKFVESVKDDKNSIDKSFTYYTVHSNYVKFRQQSRLDEEKRDEEDRKKDIVGEDDYGHVKENNNSLESPVKSENNDLENMTSPDTNKTEREKRNISTKELEKLLKPTIEAEIIKYLGVSEPSVVNFVLSFVSSNPTLDKESKSYNDFVTELSELLEDDAPKAVKSIYNELKSLV